MPIDGFIITIYLMVDDYYTKIVTSTLRKGGYNPKLTDSEIITTEIVGEFLQMDTDIQNHQYFTQHWVDSFPTIGSHKKFAKQCANLLPVKTLIHRCVVKQHGQDNIYFIDGFPIPVCKYGRAYKHKNFRRHVSFSQCALKQEKYYGFEGHLPINFAGMITNFTFASANIDKREVALDILDNIQGLLGAILISADLSQYCFTCCIDCIDLHTPLRKNMIDSRSKSVVSGLKKARRNIETVIGQLSERLNMQKVRAKDLWHLSHRFMRKILVHNFCFVVNKELDNPPLQFKLIIFS